ncbi:hypothetical protein NPIL_360071 [Nephila pilipes]|uniref:Uncharacterized protein n=1 Tax=Nephila pilipes TaxID=299642 RepID=A0A8X6IMH5_NEPPI|nr:hypothetical protein NPIL_360071 [Nephila pilipes]
MVRYGKATDFSCNSLLAGQSIFIFQRHAVSADIGKFIYVLTWFKMSATVICGNVPRHAAVTYGPSILTYADVSLAHLNIINCLPLCFNFELKVNALWPVAVRYDVPTYLLLGVYDDCTRKYILLPKTMSLPSSKNYPTLQFPLKTSAPTIRPLSPFL